MSYGNYESWGRWPRYKPSKVIRLNWREEIPELSKMDGWILPYGCGKSYGDSCLNDGGVLLDTRGLNKFISFDREMGIIRCESGVTLAEVLDLVVPQGWFLSSTPGTKHITVGGAIANDVHGKNHHRNGTFGANVLQFELLRSNGERLICSPFSNPELYRATIGGLGLTGLITWAEFRLKPCPSPFIAMESIKFGNLDEFFEITADSDKNFEYTVSWVDCTARGKGMGKGLFTRGNHADPKEHKLPALPKQKALNFPIEAPFINGLTVKGFNILYYNKQIGRIKKALVHYNPFFYPLDAVNYWNKAYGKHGFLQYQFVIPFNNDRQIIREMLGYISKSGLSSFLTVLKTFGSMESPGMMSFPKPGVTLAVDFRMNGEGTLKTVRELDKIVCSAGGRLYPAKDARMRGEDFRTFYPQWEEFNKYVDPKFSSSFWRRVTAQV